MRWVHGLVLFVLASACRSEEPQTAPIPAEPVGGPAGAPATAPSSTATAKCVHPLPEEAAAAQKPAATCPPDTAASPPELGRGYVTFPEAPGAPRLQVELADDDAERERGLMFRTSMPEEQGMLFSWDDEVVRTFWMHNTCLPLDMLFLSKDGFVAGILEQVPVMNDSPRSVPCPAAHVLEVNAGYVRSHGVKPGQLFVVER